MGAVSNTTIGALISQDILLLANALSGESCDEQDRLIVSIKMDLNLDLLTATEEEIAAHADELKDFQVKYQELNQLLLQYNLYHHRN